MILPQVGETGQNRKSPKIGRLGPRFVGAPNLDPFLSAAGIWKCPQHPVEQKKVLQLMFKIKL